MNSAQKSLKRKIWYGILVLFVITLFIPTPYYLYQPGSVEELGSKVTVAEGDKSSQGNLYLTTVLSIKASNIYYLAYGKLARHTDIRKVEEVRGDMSDEEYSRLLEHMMSSSQHYALVSGLRAAGEDISVETDGIFVRAILPNSEAKEKLEVGDVIRKIDGNEVTQSSEFLEYLKDKRVGDQVNITFDREGEKRTESISLIALQNSTNEAGIGIVPENQYQVKTPRNVTINAKDIGGPSAGLMFSLEIYNQATKGDLTKGYEIAGTGTMDMEGNVGQIGGIREKITAVAKEGIDIFLCPADIAPGDTNEKEVMEEVEKEGYDVKIVPVKTMQEAIDYLESLPPKK